MRKIHIVLLVMLTVLVAGCSSLPQPRDDAALQREAIAGTDRMPPPPKSLPAAGSSTAARHGETSIGTGVFVRAVGASGHGGKAEKGDVVFNFENQPVQSVVKAVLGDYLKKDYAIAPGVKGEVTFSTASAVSRTQALPILETLLSWTDNALVYKDGRYMVMPSKNAVAGNLVPSLGAAPPSAGFQARLFPLHYIGAEQMRKLLKPFARENAFLLVDASRNLLVMAGTPGELSNYARTIRTFDVDWLKGMSVGVYGLQRANVNQLMHELEKLFGPKGSTPLAGMLRFIPIERTNSIVVISPQPKYLEEVRQWIDRIDRGGGNQPQLYVYDVKNVQATYLSDYLNQIYNGAAPVSHTGEAGSVGPGLTSSTLGDSMGGSTAKGAETSNGSTSGMDSGGGSDSLAGGSAGLPSRTPSSRTSFASVGASGGNGSSGANGVNITAVDENNQLLVRCRPSQWEDIRSAIERLDVVPLQVQIETRILEVKLTGEFSFGVQWYLQGLSGSTTDSSGNFTPGDPNNPRQIALGQGGNTFGGEAFFYSFVNSNLQAAVRAIETSGNTKVLSAPSLVVMNNQQAKIQVGTQVPVNQTYIASGISGSSNNNLSTLGQVQYKDTGVILQVRPRVNPGGLVYLTLNQIVSKPGVADRFGNFPIDKRQLATQIAVQSGQTVLLGGLIQQDESATDTGIPVLNRIPLLGRLFGSTSRQRNRTELLVLITPKVITSSADARAITEDYQRQFESLAPLRAEKKAAATKKEAPGSR